MPRRGRGGGDLSRALPERLRDRRPVAAGRPARRGGGGDRRDWSRRARTCGRPRRRRAAAPRAPPLQLRRGHPPRARCSGVARRRTCRTTASSTRRGHFASGERPARRVDPAGGQEVPSGHDLVFRATDVPGLALHVEICEDMWVPVPPSARAALAGATVLANISGLADHRRSRGGPASAGPFGECALPGGVRLRRGG